MTPEQLLMQKIKSECGPYIDAAVKGTPYPAALLAALVAGESGGNVQATRFEHLTLGQLSHVIIGTAAAFGADHGHRATFGAIGRADLLAWCTLGLDTDQAAQGEPAPEGRGFSDALLALVNLATSWGPTQIMGYEALAGKYPLGDLPNLERHFPHTVAMLEDFRKRFRLTAPDAALAGDVRIGDYFRCWNTGRPDGKTFDPAYVSNGHGRMTIYGTL